MAQFLIEKQELNANDTVLIVGPTTGEQEIKIEKMLVNGQECATANIGDKVTFAVPFRIRLSDKIYKI